MQVEELFDLTTWIKHHVSDTSVLQDYRQLHNILQQNAQPNQQKQPFENEKNALVASLQQIPFSDLSTGQIEILNSIGIGHNIGDEGVDALENTLFRNAIDVATAAQKIQASINQLEQGLQWSQQTSSLLQKITSADSFYEDDNTALLRVRFTGGAHLSNLSEFKDWGKTWWDIGRGISMAVNNSPEGIKVVGASNGSIVITLSTCYEIAALTSGILMSVFLVAEKYIVMMQQWEKLKALKLQNKASSSHFDTAADEIKKGADEIKVKGIEQIIQNTAKEAKLDPAKEGDKLTALRLSIEKLADFIEKGGEVDFIMPDESATEEDDDDAQAISARRERELLRTKFSELRKLEQLVKQLEHKKD